MTIPPPSADETLLPLRSQVDELTRVLQDGDAADPVQLKQRIFLLHRAVTHHAQVVGVLQDEVRHLVDVWKIRYGAPVAVGISDVAPAPRSAVASQGGAATTATLDAARRLTPAPVPTLEVAFTTRTATPELTGAQVARAFGTPTQGQPRIIDELNASTFVERGWSKIASGDFSGAEVALAKALDLNPGDAQAESLLGWAQTAQGRFDEAVGLLDRVLERHPDHALAHLNLGWVHLRRGEYDAALERLTHTLALDSDRKATLYAHFYLGLVRYEQEQYAEAAGALLRAIELGPNLVEARFELGRVYWFTGRTDDAISAWRKGAEVNKFNPWSARCREMLATIADGGAPSRVS